VTLFKHGARGAYGDRSGMTKKRRKSKSSKSARHAEVEHVDLFGTTARLGPYGLIQFANQYLSAAKNIEVPEIARGFSVVRTFLACRAVELALKAFLALKGRSLVELMGPPYRHDLKNLVEEAEKRNLQSLVKLDDRQRAEIIRASDYYAEKVLEYPSLKEAISGYPKMPNTDTLIVVVDALIRALQEPCLNAE
jgi:HEPN domain-containing protein